LLFWRSLNTPSMAPTSTGSIVPYASMSN
jgi:hypothetical protein